MQNALNRLNHLNLRWLLALCLMSALPTAHACLDAGALKTLAEREISYMTQRIPPAFADAVSDQLIIGHMQLVQAEPCQAKWVLNLPASDIAEAQALLDAQPAKQIMLAAQGYAIPAQTQLEAVLNVDAQHIQPKAKEELQTAELGKLRASVELMYAMLTQARADQQTQAVAAWSAAEVTRLNTACAQQFSADNVTQACECRTQGISKQYTLRQVTYNQYLSSNPYAFATGNGGQFKQLEKQLLSICGLKPVSP